jgi:hypothetical protein
MRVRTDCLMPRANNARGKVFGALPRIPARGTPPGAPARFPFGIDVPERSSPSRVRFAAHKPRAPLTAPGRSEDLPIRRESGQMQNLLSSRLFTASRWSDRSCSTLLE